MYDQPAMAPVGGGRWTRRTRTLSGFLSALLPALAAGCSDISHVNGPLNGPGVVTENRRPNVTRSATFARVTSPAQAARHRLTAVPELRADPAPTTAAAATVPPPDDADGCFVGLALSGGGSRSANFAAACMFELQRLGLLQRVDYVSTVSGGTLPGAYYCLSTPAEWNPGDVQRKLTHSFAGDVIGGSFAPWNFASLALTDFDRSDMLARSFKENLFSRGGRALTFADLRPDRPRLLVNATDLQSGRRFVFCNETFDEMNSDLSRLPVAWAAAASSAVPVLLHPVTFRDYSTAFRQYRHLIDGGVVDNLGITTLVETYAAHVASARARGGTDPYPNGVVLIVLDAHTHHDEELSEKSDIGFLGAFASAAGLSSTSLLNRASSATLADLIIHSSPDDVTAKELRAQIDRLNAEGFLALTDRTGHRARVLYVALAQVNELTDLPFASFGESVNSIATYFNIRPTEAYRLYQAAGLLFRARFDERVREVVRELDAGKDELSSPRSQ